MSESFSLGVVRALDCHNHAGNMEGLFKHSHEDIGDIDERYVIDFEHLYILWIVWVLKDSKHGILLGKSWLK
jgi:hypothetical protein